MLTKPHGYRVGTTLIELDEPPTGLVEHRRNIEPWLSAVFQSEHLSLLVGNGLTTAIANAARVTAPSMRRVRFNCELEEAVDRWASDTAKKIGRDCPNVEDQLRAALRLVDGLSILDDPRRASWVSAVDRVLLGIVRSVLAAEKEIAAALQAQTENGVNAQSLLVAFLLSFASRATSRERLNIFTTNYDRLIEYGCDLVGMRSLDRFVGALAPRFRASRLDVDVHYNPPGIRGEPRYLEGVVRLTKLHGSLDWRYSDGAIQRESLPFGAPDGHPGIPVDPSSSLLIYPNPAKDLETIAYPYAELFRDFSAALCRPNSTLVAYGYGFGDEHVNRIISDMLTIPSTHLVIISFDQADGRIEKFLNRTNRDPQISLLLGSHFADLETLVRNYLPKPAIDTISVKRADLIRRRDVAPPTADVDKEDAL